MISSKLRNPSPTFSIFRNTSIISANSLPLYSISLRPRRLSFELTPLLSISPSPSPSPSAQLVLRNDSPFELVRASKFSGEMLSNEEGNPKTLHEVEDLSENSVVYKKTLALVECSMFAALTGLVYFLSNSLALENYFGFFFSLPVVISSMRWGIAAGRKTMVSTFLLLLVLSGPVKALTYLLKHGIVGFTMGTLWRCGADWSLSIFLCTILRSTGALGYVIITSFLIRENILALITINIHASLTFLFTASGVNTIPSMEVIYVIFGTLVLLNSGCFMFLLHLLYSVFLSGIGMRASLALPKWLEKAI